MKEFMVMALFVVLILAASLGSCSSENDVMTAAADAGLHDVHSTGHRWFGCDKDRFSTGFEATNANGKHVTGVVCSGFLKGKTIRYD